MPSLKLTKSSVESLPYTTSGQLLYFDTELKGFGVRIGVSAKSYFVQRDIFGRTRRITIGPHGVFTTEQARREAVANLQRMACGIDPVEERRLRKAASITLSDCFQDFLNERRKLKAKTVYDYTRVMQRAFCDWQSMRLVEISKDMVGTRFRTLTADSGEAYANLSMRTLRSVLNFAAGRYENARGESILPENPVRRLSQTRAWHRDRSRRNYLEEYQLAPWFKAVTSLQGEKGESVGDYLQLLVLTGLRRQEAARLRWDDINLAAALMTVGETKNGEPHTLPLSDYLLELLNKRKSRGLGEGFVFPGNGKLGYLVEPRPQIRNVISDSGVTFTIHDLRRTFITIAEGLDVPAYTLKRLLNHAISGDVTASYIGLNVERLRGPIQAVTDHVLQAAGIRSATGNVLKFRRIRPV